MIVSYNWLQEYLGEDAPTAERVADLLGAHAFEIEEVVEKDGDTIIDVDVLPNRSSDCLCHRGIAREVATLLGTELVHDPLATPPELSTTDQISVAIEDQNDCSRFTAALITGVEIKESPDWLKERLEAIGQRPINNIVDATNYVMFALGQPLHAYDADLFPQVDGQWQFGVRKAKAGETVSLLAEGGKDEDRVVELSGSELLIIDESSNTPIGLAGVKGGRFAGVHAGTTKVIIEAAHFNPILTRKTARGLGIVIDASKRFENEPSEILPPYAQAEIIKLITDIADGESQGMIDVYPGEAENIEVPVLVSATRVNALLGLSLEAKEMKDILERAGIAVLDMITTRSPEGVEETVFTAVGPAERTDLLIAEDIIEEIGRIYGYDHVVSVVPDAVPLDEINIRHYYSEQVRAALIDLGFSEVITSSFRKKDAVKLKNALASDKIFLRSNLSRNVAETLDKNSGLTDLLGATDTRVFELGTVFEVGGEYGVTEHVSLAIGIRIKQSGYTGKEDKLLTAALTAVETALDTKIDWSIEKGVAETNFTAVFESLPNPDSYDKVEIAKEITYQPFSLYPAMSRDIAMWVPGDTTPEDIENILNTEAGDLRVRTTLFDEFEPARGAAGGKDGQKSFAFRLVFQSMDKTLTDEEVNAVMDRVYKAIEAKGWETR